MDRLSPDLHVVWQMFSLCVLVHLYVLVDLAVGLQVLLFINVVHFLSVRLQPPGHSSLQSNIPHTPEELRERPVAKQGANSGMSLLSQ